MVSIAVISAGETEAKRSQGRGKLFEKIMADVLRGLGYTIDKIANVNYSGMEIDIEGKSIATETPLYCECKCYSSEVDSPKLQAFFGKFMAKWHKDKRSQGIFIAIPGVNSHAKAFYREYVEGAEEFTVRLFEENVVIDNILKVNGVISHVEISKKVTPDLGYPGDCTLLSADNGFFWAQYIIPVEGGIPNKVALFDKSGNSVSNKTVIDFITSNYSDIKDFDVIEVGNKIDIKTSTIDVEEIVEVRGSSECFEYQFPSSPEFFVGRDGRLKELEQFLLKVVNSETSSRGILFEGNSGWGKSSLVLASVNRITQLGHYAIAIDSRSAASSQFILRVIDYTVKKFDTFNGIVPEELRDHSISGFEGGAKKIIDIGHLLEGQDKVLFIFLDQFENVFLLQDALRKIRDLLLKICDARTNIVFGFSWKSDLIGLTNDFPYALRDSIVGSSFVVPLNTFSEAETNAMLDKLSKEIHAPLRKDLRFLISEFAQGYPWLLKRLCAHVKMQVDSGIQQTELAQGLLKIEELFHGDLNGLSADEEETLRIIAKSAPISADLGDELSPEIVQSLINRRLVVRIGSKFDIYWDIFRDYLNTGLIPVHENYMLRMKVGSIVSALKVLCESNGRMPVVEFQNKVGLRQNSFYNLSRDMRLLGITEVDGNEISLKIDLPKDGPGFETKLRAHVKERLKRNRIIWMISEELKQSNSLSTDKISVLLKEWCPYISASDGTWEMYAITFSDWMDVAGLAIFDSKNGMLHENSIGTQLLERHLSPSRKKSGLAFPAIQYSPIENAAIRLVEAHNNRRTVDWSGFNQSTLSKVLTALEDIGFIMRRNNSLMLQPRIFDFVNSKADRPSIFGESALKMPTFQAFIEIINSNPPLKVPDIVGQFAIKTGAPCKPETIKWYVKIMLDWGRHANLIPMDYLHRSRNRENQDNNQQKLPL